MKRTRIVLTGGHLTPALAVIDELEKDGNWEIHFIGRKHASESSRELAEEVQVIQKRGIRFYFLVPGRLQRKMTVLGIRSLLRIPIGFFQSLILLRKIEPDVVLSFGGYVGFPVTLSAFFLAIPIVIHEQTTVPGLANRLTAQIASKIAVSWQGPANLEQKKVVVTGNPIRSEIFHPNLLLQSQYKLNHKLPTILITGGNQGSHAINIAIIPILPELLNIANVIFLTGSVNIYTDYERASSFSTTDQKGNLLVFKYLQPENFAVVLNLADLVVGRSGANTVSELAATGKPAIFIPLPWSSGKEQYKNANLLEKFGSRILPQKKLNPEALIYAIRLAIKNLAALQKQATLAKKLVSPEAARKLVKVIKSVVQ